LIGTVWAPFSKEFVENLAKEIGYVMASHAEIDHSGAPPGLMRQIPEKLHV
jgi:flavorubredoxin